MNRKFVHIILILIVISGPLRSQDPIFSISDFEELYLNPAYSFNAITEDTRVSANLKFRDQWNAVNVGDVYNTSRVLADFNIYKSYVDGFNGGIMFLSDRSNTQNLKTTSIYFQGSYTRKISGGRGNDDSQFITLGSSFAFSQTNMDLQNLWFSRQYDINRFEIDQSLESGEEGRQNSIGYRDLNIGARWMMMYDDNKYIKIGLSVSHINGAEIEGLNSSYNMTSRYVLHAESSLELSERLYHKPSILFISQNPFWQIVPAYRLSIDITNLENPFALVIGPAARILNSTNGVMMDAILLEVGLESQTWNFKFNFDINTSSLQTFTNGNGAIELSLGYKIVSN